MPDKKMKNCQENNKGGLVKKIAEQIWKSPKNLLYYALEKPLKPKWLWFEVTDRCNSRCRNCHIWQKKSTSSPLTIQEIERVFSDPLFSDLEFIINSGGEITLRNDIEEILLLEHRFFPKAGLNFSTNGLIPGKALPVIKAVIQKGVELNVGVSLDAVGAKHDEIRGVRGNFEKADYLLKELAKLKKVYKNLSVIVGETLSPITLPYVKDVKEYAENLGVDFSMQWYNQSSFYDNCENNIAEKNQNGLMVEAVNTLPENIHKEMWLNWLKGKPIKFRCFALNTFCVLRCDGSISPCLSLWDKVAGNVREQSPSEIWSGRKAKLARGSVKKCPGCLNSWGVWWSLTSNVYPRLFYYLRNPKILVKDIKKKFI